MKSIRLNNWQKTDDLDCLLFFALRSRELVFDFSLDSYKYPALNSATICAEAITLINEIENGNFAMKSLIPVLEELTNKLNSDIIAKYILGSDIEYYINFGDYTNIKEIKVKIEILLNKINPLKYKTIIEKRLLSLILENKEKRKIYEIATSYISTLINIGFSQSYINQCINKTFFSRASINDIAVLNSYFKLFEIKKETYKCIFSVSEIFEEIKTSSNVFKCEISDSLDAGFQQLDKKIF